VKIKVLWDGNLCHLVNILGVVWTELDASSVGLLDAADGGIRFLRDVVTAD
jgi:hypothetical protein